MYYLDAIREGIRIYSKLPDNPYVNQRMLVLRRGWGKPKLAEFAIYDMIVAYKKHIDAGYPSGLFGWIEKV